MKNSIVLDCLTEATPESIQSAIIIMDGTELFDNPDYQLAKEEYVKDNNIPFFIMAVRPLYEPLLQTILEQ